MTLEAAHAAVPDEARPTGELTGAEAIVRVLESFGIQVMFGLCGHTNLAMLDALEKSAIRFVGVRHEQVAAHAADGYFRATHEPAAILTTIGPGLTNALTGIGDAALDCVPMIVVSGDVPSYLTGADAFQELNLHGDAQQVDVVRPLVKRAWRIAHRDQLVHDVSRACSHAVTGRPGPVLIDVPLDYFSARAVEQIPAPQDWPPLIGRIPAADDPVDAAVTRLLDSERAVIYVGGGAALSEAQAEVTALAEYLGVPVVTTLSGQGVIAKDHELYAGYTATVGTPVAHRTVNEADLVLVLGSQLAEMDTSSFSPEVAFRVPPTAIIQVDIDPTQLGKNYPAAIGIQADIRTFVAQLLARLRERAAPRDWRVSARYVALRRAMDEWTGELAAAARSDAVPITVERLLVEIRRALPRDGLFLTDVGIRHQVAQQFPVYSPQTHYVGSGWGTMGGAVGAALGAKLGRPHLPVVAEVGDGAFSSVLSAVVTAVEHGIGCVWVVMNNFCYSSISVYQTKHGLGTLGTSFHTPDGRSYNPDFAALAQACGARGRRIDKPADLRPALDEAIASDEPWVLDVHTEVAPRTRASGYWDVNDVLSGERFRPSARL